MWLLKKVFFSLVQTIFFIFTLFSEKFLRFFFSKNLHTSWEENGAEIQIEYVTIFIFKSAIKSPILFSNSSPSYRCRHTSLSSSYRPSIALTSPPSLCSSRSSSRRSSVTSLYEYDPNKHYINHDTFSESKFVNTIIKVWQIII